MDGDQYDKYYITYNNFITCYIYLLYGRDSGATNSRFAKKEIMSRKQL